MAGKFTVEAIFSGKDRFSGMLGSIEQKVGRFAGGMQGQLAKLDKFGAKAFGGMKSAALLGAAGVGALGAAGAIGIKKLAEPTMAVEDALARVETAITPATGTIQDALNETKHAAIEWSKAHKQSAEQFLEANYRMASASFNSTDAIAGTNTALAVATATLGDAEVAGNLLAGLMNNLGDRSRDTAAEFTRLGDIITKTQAKFQIADLQQLNDGFTYAAPAAKMYGLSVEQLATSIGTLNTANLQGSLAGTSLAASLRQLGKGSKELGFAIAKSASGGVDLIGTIENMEKKYTSFAAMSDENKAKFQSAFGDEGVKGIALMLGKSKQLRADLADVTNSMGAAAAAQKIFESKRSGQLEILNNRIDAIKISLGDSLLPVLERAMPTIDRVVTSVDRWATANGTLLRTEVSEAIDKGRFAVELFANGVERGATAVKSIISPLASFVGMFSDAPTWPVLVNDLGLAVGALVPLFFGVMVYSRLAGVALWGFQVATKAVTGAVWLANQAQWAWRAAQIQWLLYTEAGIGATVLGRVATIASTAATWLANAARWALSATETLFTGRIVASTVATEAATVATGEAAASFVSAELALAPLVITLGAAAAAMAAWLVVYQQWQELKKAAGGAEGVWEGVKSFATEMDFSAGVDRYQNKLANEAFAAEQAKTAAAGSPSASDQVPGQPAATLSSQAQLDAFLASLGHPSGAPAAQGGAPGPAAQGSQLDASQTSKLNDLINALGRNQQADKLEIDVNAPEGTEVRKTSGGGKRPIRVSNSGKPKLPASWD